MLYTDHLEIRETKDKGKGIFAKHSISVGQILLSLSDDAVFLSNKESSTLAIQIDIDLYLESKSSQIWHFWNHGCIPNTMFDGSKLNMVAIRDIHIDEEITFHYCTTEFDLLSKGEAFQCKCGSNDCIGMVSGYRHLSEKQKDDLMPYLASYLTFIID